MMKTSSKLFLGIGSSIVGGLGVPSPLMEVTLPDTEWLCRMVDMLLDVSDDIVESGLVMYSNLSANPTTRGRGMAPVGIDNGTSGGVAGVLTDGAVVPSGWDAERVGNGGGNDFAASHRDGVEGKLFVF